MNKILLTGLLLVTAAAAFAADLGKYNKWEESPEAYFLTSAERTEWQSVATPEAAEQFVTAFRTKRGGEAFTKELAKRVEMADKYLTIGKVKGSTALRGKLVIVFGAPAGMEITDKKSSKNYSGGATSMGGGGELGAGMSMKSEGATQVAGGAQPGQMLKDYKLTFPAKANPSLGGQDLTVVVEVDAGTGKDRMVKKADAEALEAKLEAAAKASIKQ
jgi:GWxTD domain-containing protein